MPSPPALAAHCQARLSHIHSPSLIHPCLPVPPHPTAAPRLPVPPHPTAASAHPEDLSIRHALFTPRSPSLMPQVTPRLYVGGIHALDDGLGLIHAMRITTIMSIAPRLTAEFKASVAAAVEDSATFHELNHKTFGSGPEVLAERIETLRQHMADPGKTVLVHCRSGQHRSVAVVVGYLMISQWADWDAAFTFVRRLRPCADDEYKELVKSAVACLRGGAARLGTAVVDGSMKHDK